MLDKIFAEPIQEIQHDFKEGVFGRTLSGELCVDGIAAQWKRM